VTDLIALVGGILLATLAIAAFVRWEPLVILTLLAVAAGSFFGAELGIKAGITTIYPEDLLAAIALAAAALRLVRFRPNDSAFLWWLITSIALALAVVYGASRFGPVTSLIFVRKILYVVVVAIYLMTFRFDRASIMRAATLWMVSAVAVMAFGLLALLFPSIIPEGLQATPWEPSYVQFRVMTANAALTMGQAALIGIGLWAEGNPRPLPRILGLALMGMTVLQFHRSVWLATVAGILAISGTALRRLRSLLPAFALFLVCAVAGVLFARAMGHDLFSSALSQAIIEPLDQQRSTAAWRIVGWRILLGEAIAEGPLRVLIGGGFGVGYERFIGWSEIEYSPHNLYVEIFLNAGLMGLLPFLLFFAVLLRNCMRRTSPYLTNAEHSTASALLVSILVYCVSYSLSMDQGILIGILAAALRPDARAFLRQPA